MDDLTLPIACNLTEPEFQKRRATILDKVRAAVVEVKELEGGYGYRFPSEPIFIVELAEMMSLERECCPFLRFNLRLEPSGGPIWMELSGPEGTKKFLTSIF